MIKKTISFLIFGMIAQQSVLYAQQNLLLGKIWTETEKNYSGIRAVQSAIESSEYNEEAVKASALPQIKLQYQNTYGTLEGSNGGFFPQSGFFNVSGVRNSGASTSSNNFGSAIVEYEIFNFGRQRAEVKAASTFTEKVKTDKETYLLKLKKMITQRYIDFLFNEAKLDWAKKNSKRLEGIHNSSKALSSAGLKPEADSVLTYSSYVQALATEDYSLENQRASLEKLKEFYPQNFNSDDYSVLFFLNPVLNSNSEGNLTIPHPFLQSLHKESEYYLTKADVQKRSALPSIKVLGGYAYRGTGIDSYGAVSGNLSNGFSNSTNNVLVGLGMTWNVSSLYTNKEKSNMLTKEAERLSHLENQYKLSLQTEISALQNKISGRQEQLRKEHKSVKGASEAYEMYAARYKSGLITLTELLQIRQILENAEKSQIDAAREFWQQIVDKAELTGDFNFLFTNL